MLFCCILYDEKVLLVRHKSKMRLTYMNTATTSLGKNLENVLWYEWTFSESVVVQSCT